MELNSDDAEMKVKPLLHAANLQHLVITRATSLQLY